jgi:L-iditol 2-dehydrogenase
VRALRLLAYGNEQVAMCEAPVPEIGPGDLLIAVKYAGICGSDVAMFRGCMGPEHRVFPPVTLGHEFAGVVERIGAAVTGFVPGDPVTVETHAVVCGQCEYCRTGHPGFCQARRAFGHAVDGAFADYICVPERVVHCVPDGVSLVPAAATEPSAVAYNAVVEVSRVRPGDRVLVIGPGTIGLLALQMARLCGAAQAIVVGLAEDGARLELARQSGADAAISWRDGDPAPAVRDLTGGEGVDLVIDGAGNEQAVALSLAAVRPMGQITKIGWGAKPLDLSLDPIIQKAVTYQGSFSHAWPMWERCLRLMRTGQLRPEAISQVLPLDCWRDGIALVESRKAVKVVLAI